MEPARDLASASSSAPLSASERGRLLELEAVVERGLRQFVEVALALVEIKERRLHREAAETFEEYVARRFGLARRTAYGYIEAAGVAANVPAEAHLLSLSHLRALAPLAPDEQRQLAALELTRFG